MRHYIFSPQLYTFSTSNDNWRLYDWDKITTVAQFGGRNDDMMCYAHSKGVRVVSAGKYLQRSYKAR